MFEYRYWQGYMYSGTGIWEDSARPHCERRSGNPWVCQGSQSITGHRRWRRAGCSCLDSITCPCSPVAFATPGSPFSPNWCRLAWTEKYLSNCFEWDVANDHVKVKHLAEFSTPVFYGSGWRVATFMNYDVGCFGLCALTWKTVTFPDCCEIFQCI